MEVNFTLTSLKLHCTKLLVAALLLLVAAPLFAASPPGKIPLATTALPPTYCQPEVWTGDYEHISKVTFGVNVNSSGGSGYADHTNVIFNATRGSQNTLIVEIGAPYSSDRAAVWIDWNQDGDFNDASETIALAVSSGIGPYSGTVTVPSSALLGQTRMRIVLSDNPISGPCVGVPIGEVEDYTINVLPVVYCSAGVSYNDWEHITSVSFNGVANNSSYSGYANYTNVVFEAARGSANTLTITLDFAYFGNRGSVWIDWNQDGDFNDTSESIPLTVSTGEGPYSGTVNVPAGVLLGNTLMRIRVSNENHSSCGNTIFGEVEDYTINVVDRRYVKQGATGDGLSWATASGDLQAMINNVPAGSDVWVAAGDYQPAAGQSFAMRENVKIYGGFPATGNPMMADRNYSTNVTQLLGNGSRVITNNNNGLTNLAVLDGFTVANGILTGSGNHGGGIMNLNSYPTIQNCIFKNNSSADRGGALYNEVSYTTKVINCLFYNNTAFYGGASMDFAGADTHYVNCTFSGNTADYGGALLTTANSNIMAYNCIFWGNAATTTANEIYLPGSTADIFNCLINVTPQNVAGGSNFTQTNTVSGDPQFVNAATGNYSLKGSSPAINAGSNAYFTDAATAKDLANTPRLYNNGTIDIGAYEYQGLADCSVTTTWNGTTWDNGAPVSDVYNAVIDGSFTSSGNLTACSLTVNSGTVTVTSGHNFIIKGAVAVNGGTLTFDNNTNLVQRDDVANTGTITYKRNSNPLYHLDYTMWSSPTSGTQTLKEFSPFTLNESFYVYNTTLNAYSNYTSASGIFGGNPNAVTFTRAKGYLIRMPAGLPQGQTSVFNGIFTGTPNNGSVSIALGTGGSRFNAVGNPYPSAINVYDFIDGQPAATLDNGTLYFWRKTNNPAETTYATMTKLAYNANTGDGGEVAGTFTGQPNTWVINAGQGFMVKAATGATALSFTNSMRRAVNNGQFFRTAQDADEEHAITMSRFWLDITNGTGGFGQTVIGYTNVTTTNLDYGWDGRFLNDGQIALYTLAENTRLAIQARDAFTAADVVPMGYKAAAAGSLTIALGNKDGLFLNGQSIYLVDKTAGTTHNISATPYTFTTAAGTFDDRFDVVYADGNLGTDNPVVNDADVIVYKQDNRLVVKATGSSLDDVKVFDIRGRLLYKAGSINAAEHSIDNLHIAQQAIIIQIKTADGSNYSKKTLY